MEDEDGPDSCDHCGQCLKVEHGNHPDLLILRPDGQQIKIDQIRQAQEFISIRPLEAPRRVLIVDEAENMNEPTQNAFLKTLEEPPSTAMVFLITMNPDRLLPTVRSRCFHLRFGLLNTKDTEEVIKRLLPQTGHEELSRLVRLSMGRPGLVLSPGQTWDPVTAMESVRSGEIVPQTKDRAKLLSLIPFYEVLLRDVLVKKVSHRADLYILPEVSGMKFSKKLTWKDIIELYMKVQYLKDIWIYNPNVSVVANYLRSHLGVLYE